MDVADDDGLFERYGERVPVLVRPDLGLELPWPFDARGAQAFVSRPR